VDRESIDAVAAEVVLRVYIEVVLRRMQDYRSDRSMVLSLGNFNLVFGGYVNRRKYFAEQICATFGF
jgi:hypothetical protein